MRKINRFRRDVARNTELQELFNELSDMRATLFDAYVRFNSTTEPELVDACVYEINAAQSRYDYLLRRIKESDGQAALKICSEGASTWV